MRKTVSPPRKSVAARSRDGCETLWYRQRRHRMARANRAEAVFPSMSASRRLAVAMGTPEGHESRNDVSNGPYRRCLRRLPCEHDPTHETSSVQPSVMHLDGHHQGRCRNARRTPAYAARSYSLWPRRLARGHPWRCPPHSDLPPVRDSINHKRRTTTKSLVPKPFE